MEYGFDVRKNLRDSREDQNLKRENIHFVQDLVNGGCVGLVSILWPILVLCLRGNITH